MTKRTSAVARVLAAIALIAAFVVLFMVVTSALESGDGDGGDNEARKERVERKQKERKAPKTYTVEPGDTLTAISRQTGIPIGQIERLNPKVDPQILVEGEELKLK